MTDIKLRLYQMLPSRGRSLIATLRGAQLRRWRYGRETDRLVEEAVERDYWTSGRWRAWTEERLAFVLERAARNVPFYREHWQARRREGDRAAWDQLKNWPLLEKETVRTRATDLVADDLRRSGMFHEHTSGTSGTPIDLWWSRATVREWYALVEARCRVWNGVTRDDVWAIFGGQLVVRVNSRRPPFWVWNGAMNQLYCSSYHLSASTASIYAEALRRHRVKYVLGYTSSLYELATGLLDAKAVLPMTVAISNAEPVYPHQREAIEKAFACPLREAYGMAEIVAAASECGEGRLHVWPEVGLLEALDSPSRGEQDLVATGLLNSDMPLVRYRVGDSFVPSTEIECRCGRGLPLIEGISGRSDDVLVGTDGRSVGRMDPVFKTRLPIREAQIVQESLDQIRVVVVPSPGFSEADERTIRDRIRARLGDVTVSVDRVLSIPRDRRGKFRAVISKVKASSA